MKKSKMGVVISFIILCAVTLVAIFPFYMMLIMSTYKSQELAKSITMLPGGYLMQNLTKILSSGFLNYYWNSIYITVCTTILSVLVSAMTGYGFAKFKFKLNKVLYAFIIASMMIPTQVGLIGYVIEMRTLHMANTREAVMALYIANCFGVFWLTQFIRSGVPDAVIESARIDGCSEFGIFFKIVLAYVKPGLATLAILQFMWNWNNYLLPLVILSNPDLYPVTLGIAALGNRYSTDYAAQICALSIGTVPLILLFIAGSKYFIQGLTAGDIKG